MNRLIVLIALVLPITINAQFFKDKTVKDYNGFFNFYYEESTDKIYLEVNNLDQEFLYVNSLASGVGSNDIGLDRGQLGNTRVVKFIKAGNKLLLVQPNQKFRAITDNELEKRSVEQAFAKSVLFGFKIENQKNGRYIIDFTPFLMQDAHGIIQKFKQQKEGSYKLDKTKSALALERIKAFPKNVEFEALLTFTGQPTGKHISTVVPTSQNITVTQHHSFIELPDDGYKMRKFDTRSGSYPLTFIDYATPVQEPITKRYIMRHRLEKKNLNADVSEAKEPIIYYLDSGAPEPVKSALIEGASWWNQAFEAIGYKNAFQVKVLPADADPMDCRYNVIQWVHRSTRGWSYGASVVDPRTGEIIKGHVSLGSLRIRQDLLIAQAMMNKPFAENDDNYQPMLDLALARIRQLGAHEVGHTLGFAHNFSASTNNRASVMDYPHPQFELNNGTIDFKNAYAKGIGEWDKVTVAYSYSDKNETELQQLLNNTFKNGYRYITDYDARVASGANAHAHLWDNGILASKELNDILKIRALAIKNFSIDNIKTNEPYSVLEDVFVPLYFAHRYQVEATTKLIGGMEYNYAVKGGEGNILKNLDAKTQQEAMQAILKTLDAKTLAIPKEKLKLFPPRAYGYSKTRESFKGETGVAFDPFSASSTASDFVLKFLLNPQRMNRLVVQQSQSDTNYSLNEMLTTLINGTIKKTNTDVYENEIQQMINTNVLKYMMNLAVNDDSFMQTKAIANSNLKTIEAYYKSKTNDIYAEEYLKTIKNFKTNAKDFKLKDVPKIPDGSPIGTTCTFNH